MPPERVQGAAKNDMAARLLRIAAERLAGELGALLEAAVLAGNQRQIIKRVGVGRIDAQHVVVARRGFVDSAAPMQRQAFLQQLAGRGRGHGGNLAGGEVNRHAGGHDLAVTTWRPNDPGLRMPSMKKRSFHRPDHHRSGEHRRPDGPVILYGWHSVTAALANPARRIRRLLATENALRRLAEDGIALPVTPEQVRPDALAARLTPDAVHQGLIAEADPLPSPDIEDLPATGIVLVLDQITDPHNVGAILRTAAAFAVG